MPFDTAAAIALAEAAACTFAEGLRGLVAAAEAEVDAARGRVLEEERSLTELIEAARAQLESDGFEVAEYRETLSGEAARLHEANLRLQAAEAGLAEDRARFEDDRRLWGKDTVDFNVGGIAKVSALRTTLCQCEDSMLAASLSGRWSVQKDADGQIFVDFPPKLFVPLVEHMQLRSIEDPEAVISPPTFESVEEEAQFQRMLSYYGLLEWVYRPEPMQFSMPIGKHRYAVLPPCSPREAVAGRDMQDQALLVPRGWEVLAASSEDFRETMCELTAHCWGAHLLCVDNAHGGFDSYRTAVRTVGGPPGSIFQADIDWLEQVDGNRCIRFRGLSGRLVVRAKYCWVAAAAERHIGFGPAG